MAPSLGCQSGCFSCRSERLLIVACVVTVASTTATWAFKKIFSTRGVLACVLSLLCFCTYAAETWSIAREEELDEGKFFVDPPIGQPATREIGESLVRTGVTRVKTVTSWNITLKEKIDAKMGFAAMFRAVKANAGASGQMLYHSAAKSPMLCVTSAGVPSIYPAAMAGCFVDTDKDGKFDALAFPGHTVDNSISPPVPYEMEAHKSSVEVEDPRSYSVDVLYQGLSKGEVKISYREFKGGLARPAFTQDVSYELDADGTGLIAFRGLRIQVIKATREGITYIVQKLGTAPI
jgi:hypothetical protein